MVVNVALVLESQQEPCLSSLYTNRDHGFGGLTNA